MGLYFRFIPAANGNNFLIRTFHTAARGRKVHPILFPYGNGHVELTIDCPNSPAIIDYHSEAGGSAEAIIEEALRHPVAGKPLHELAAGRSRAVILVSDGTRLCPSRLFLPALLGALNRGGIADDRIRIVVALGMHRKHTDAELKRLVGEEAFERVAVVNHSAQSEDCIAAGTTSLGTPIEINRLVVEADLLIATGNIEPHRLVGVSGGVKALIPGTASHRCIEANHALSGRYKAALGDPDNPIHRDLEEALAFVPIHFLFNVIANHRQELLEAYSGELIPTHRRGLEAARKRFFVPVSSQYDIVLASTGGSPKDLQLYQAIKTMQNASAFTKPGGSIVLLARCEEMFGNGIFQYWVETIRDRPTMLRKLKEQFVLGAHKVAQIEQIVSKHTVYLYSDMPDALIELAGFIPVNDLQQLVSSVIHNEDCEVAMMPHGALTFPAPE
jgi:nickel-dependent lactate racemase